MLKVLHPPSHCSRRVDVDVPTEILEYIQAVTPFKVSIFLSDHLTLGQVIQKPGEFYVSRPDYAVLLAVLSPEPE